MKELTDDYNLHMTILDHPNLAQMHHHTMCRFDLPGFACSTVDEDNHLKAYWPPIATICVL